MSIVVDASVLVAALIDSGSEGVWAEEILAAAAGQLYAPELAWVETTNILRRIERAKKVSTAEADAAMEELMELDLEPLPFAPFAGRVWELRDALTSDDAWYVAVAEALRLPLATLDSRLAGSAGAACEFLTPNE